MKTEPHALQSFAIRGLRSAILLMWISGGIIGVVILSVWGWNRSAAREWQRVKTDLEAKGETFDLQRLLPAAPPDAMNFGAIAPLKDLALIVDGDVEKGSPAELRRSFPSIFGKRGPSTPKIPSPYSGAWQGKSADLSPWAEDFRKNGQLLMPQEPSDAASDILAAIDITIPTIKELAAGTSRPESQFTPPLAKREWAKLLVAQQVPHFNTVQNAANLLRLRAIAAGQSNDGKTATESVLAMSKLAEALAQEPFLIAHLVSVTIISMTHAALWEGLNRRIFSAEELAAIQSALMRHDGRAKLLYALRTEMVSGISTIEEMKAKRSRSSVAKAFYELDVSFFPRGWFDQNARALASTQWQNFIEPLKSSGFRAALNQTNTFEATLPASRKSWLSKIPYLLADMLCAGIPSVIRRSANVQSINEMALAATAAERYYLLHHQYPASLGELGPDLIPSGAIDGLNGQPLRYRVTEDGRYMIWSLGFDGIDDAGKVSADTNTGEIGSNLHRSTDKGDWVWQYTPVQP
jgi:hypothetical protein